MPREGISVSGQKWVRDELIVAFNLYCKMPFGQYHARNPRVIQLAALIGRTPNAVAMKLCNFASFDPTHQRRGIRGLRNAGRADEGIWNEFNSNWSELAAESERTYRELLGESPTGVASGPPPLEAPIDTAGATRAETEARRELKVRLGQAFFRETVLTAYDWRCCICDLPCPDLLIASHIIPWAVLAEQRVNPRNGLALCSLHDRAFDRGLVTVSESASVVLSPRLDALLPHRVVVDMFDRFRGERLRAPEKFGPQAEFFQYHREKVFLSAG
jgi:hypothetical protein